MPAGSGCSASSPVLPIPKARRWLPSLRTSHAPSPPARSSSPHAPQRFGSWAAGWRAPWSPSAPDAAWLAQLPVTIAGWSILELAPRLLTRGAIAGCFGYLIASYTVTAAGQEATLAACLPYALAAGLVTGAGYALAWLMGEIRIRAGRAKRYVLAPVRCRGGCRPRSPFHNRLSLGCDLRRHAAAGRRARASHHLRDRAACGAP